MAALERPKVRRALVPLVFGDASLAKWLPESSLVVVSQLAASKRRAGKPSSDAGRAQLAYVTAAIESAKSGRVQAMCTAPVSKEAITKSGAPFAGHTELLAESFGVEVVMLMDGPRLRVALATNHLPLRRVPKVLSIEGLLKTLRIVSRGLAGQLGRRPRVAVCGLNPHASDGGVMGDEEARVIAPAIARARREGIDALGPFAADGLFAKVARGFPYDVAVAMFHDQGLVATKTLDFERTVNVTLGLPVPRTSPDHGVAYDIAGKGRADPQPMVEALMKAAALASKVKLRRA